MLSKKLPVKSPIFCSLAPVSPECRHGTYFSILTKCGGPGVFCPNPPKNGKLMSNQFQLLYTKKEQGWSGEKEERKATLLRFTYLYVRKYSHNCWSS